MSRIRQKKLLRERLAWKSVLHRAFEKVSSGANPVSAGPAGITVGDFRRHAAPELKKLRDEIRGRTFVASQGRGEPIWKKSAPKSAETARPITIFNIRDRILQRAILDL